MKLLLDENLSPRHAKALRHLGYDARNVTEDGLGGADDSAIRQHAITQQQILVTLDGDFANITRYTPAGTPGVIWLKLHPPSEESIAQALQKILKELTAHMLASKLAVIDEHTIRLRGG